MVFHSCELLKHVDLIFVVSKNKYHSCLKILETLDSAQWIKYFFGVLQFQKQIVSTLPFSHSWLVVIVWYDLGVFWPRKECIKNAVKLIFTSSAIRYGLDILKNVMYDLVDQEASKL